MKHCHQSMLLLNNLIIYKSNYGDNIHVQYNFTCSQINLMFENLKIQNPYFISNSYT